LSEKSRGASSEWQQVAAGVSARPSASLRASGAGRVEPTRPLRILAAEDDARLGAALAEMLADVVWAIESAQADAVGSARCKPNLMIVDARPGDGDGVSAVGEIFRGFIAHMFVGGDASKVRALESHAVAIQKPFRESDFARAIQGARAASGASWP
jgi:DNA-binding response OmpR family regulator